MPRRFGEALHSAPAFCEGAIVCVSLEFANTLEIAQPVLADDLFEDGGKPGVRQGNEAARGHTVGLVAEFLRPHVIEIAQHGLLQKLRMQIGDAVDRRAADTSEICHAYAAHAVTAAA